LSNGFRIVDFVPKWEQRYQPVTGTLAAMSRNNGAVNTAPPVPAATLPDSERLAYSIDEAAQLLGVHYFSVYRMIQRGKLRPCRVLRGKLLVPRSELLKLLKTE
jgi:excisionase family DNA binding protein